MVTIGTKLPAFDLTAVVSNQPGTAFTRITEAMTTFECEHNGVMKTGMGMTEYLDQVVDGVPIGPDYDAGTA